MTRVLDIADTRGEANHGWLYSRHTFSFSDYHNPERMGFGLLRVINDDMVAPAEGFPKHPHNNMEIISIPLEGSLGHKDSMGNKHVVRAGEIQLMSAGTGVTHSEYNNSDTEKVNFLQIWVMPKKINIKPRYEQKELNEDEMRNNFSVIIAPVGTDNVAEINQDAYFSIANIDAGNTVKYIKNMSDNGVYIFVISGKINVGTQELSERDGVGISEEDDLVMRADESSKVLCIEIPME